MECDSFRTGTGFSTVHVKICPKIIGVVHHILVQFFLWGGDITNEPPSFSLKLKTGKCALRKGRNFTSPSGFLFCLPPPFVMDKEKGFCGAPPQITSESPELYDPMHIPTTPTAQKLIRAQNCSYSGTQQPTINQMLQLNIQNNQMAS